MKERDETDFAQDARAIATPYNFPVYCSKIKKLLQLFHGVIRTIDGVTNSARVLIDLMVIAADEAFVTEEVNVLVLGAGDVLLGLDVLQAVGFIPTGREDVERDLATDGEAVIH